jgi:hypothetical protein
VGWIGVYDDGEHTLFFGHERINPSMKVMFTLDIGYKF